MTVLITGGTGDIGSAIVKEYSKNSDVVVFYRSNDQKAKELSEKYNCFCIKTDISVREEVEKNVNLVIKKYGKIDVLVNNAGISQIKLFTDITDSDWNEMINVHLTGTFNVTKAVVSNMIKRKQGSIINVSSVWGVYGASCEVHYSTVKAGLIGFTKSLSKELAPSGITVNCVAPGVIDSRMNNSHLSEEEIKELILQTPLGRLGSPEDVAKAVRYLSEASFITGQILGVDGGFY